MKRKRIIIIAIAVVLLLGITAFAAPKVYTSVTNAKNGDFNEEEVVDFESTPVDDVLGGVYDEDENDSSSHEKDLVYLSNIDYMTGKDKDGNNLSYSSSKIVYDKNDSGSYINLYIDGTSTNFIKGVCAWAKSQVVYDLRELNYDIFTTYVGVDSSEQSNYYNTGVKFTISVCRDEDMENWETVYTSSTLYGWSNAEFVYIENMQDVCYLKLYADPASTSWWAEWYDEACYADAKLIKEGYEPAELDDIDFIKSLDEYDDIIKDYDNGNSLGTTNDDYELTLMQRELVSRVGHDIISAIALSEPEYLDTLKWLMTDSEVLKLYLVGGMPEGNYLSSIKVLATLYEYATANGDLSNNNLTYGSVEGNPREITQTYSELYLKMILSLSLTQSGSTYFWLDGKVWSEPITRYEIYKDLYDEKLIDYKDFECLTVEEMRWVMNTIIDDVSIKWLNWYVAEVKGGNTNTYSYINYTFDYSYWQDKYWDPANYEMWDEKYNLSEFDIPYEEGNPKLWVVWEEGSVCGGLSKNGCCIWGSYKGLPNTCVSQPAHCAYLYYTMSSSTGLGSWNLGNDVSGWGQSGRTEHLSTRQMNDWGQRKLYIWI